MKKIVSVVLIVLCLGNVNTNAQEQSEADKFSMHGYLDVVFLGLKSEPLGRNLAYVSMYRMNIMPQYVITPKLKTTILLEGADLFRLDEGGDTDKPGIVEWAYLTYAHNSKLNVKVGTFAIPFGIYNERFYASPTQLTSFLPNSVYFKQNYANEKGDLYSTFLFPRSPSGVLLFGKIISTDKHFLTYNTYYTNESPGESLIGINKHIGGRMLYENASDKLKVGVSYNAYVGANKVLNSTFGGDVQISIKNFQLSTEVITAQIGKRDTIGMPINGSYYNSNGGYIQAGYTIKELVTPYFRYDFFDGSSLIKKDAKTIIVAGVNVAFHPQVIFKMEGYFTNNEDPAVEDTEIFISTLSIAF